MIKHYFNYFFSLFILLFMSVVAMGQQLPDPSFEDWSGAKFNGDIQPKYWHGSNVSQLNGSVQFTFIFQKEGRTGSYCAYVADREIGAVGITETGPGYMGLGTSWSYISGISTGTATAGMEGGIDFTHRPDSMKVWIKRTGTNWNQEDFNIVFYSWKGTAQSSKYKSKSGGCSSTSHTDEESDIRISTDGNECGTDVKATQVAEGWLRDRQLYENWTLVTIPIYYANDEIPEKCNVIFSAGNYPNFRANSGLYDGNALYVDDVELIYASTIQHLYIGGKEWKGFDPNSSEEQTYSVGRTATSIPEITAKRGEGSLTNTKNTTTNFAGRYLASNEMNIQYGEIDGAPTVITVTSPTGSSTHTYKIKFVSQPSNNPRLADIKVNGQTINGFNGYIGTYDVALPYGTTAVPEITYTAAEDGQEIVYTPAASPTGTATIKVTAPDGTTTMTYTIRFSVALLSDNTLQDILVNGESVQGFNPTITTYKVELPLGTTDMPTVKGVSAYPDGAQTIRYTAPSTIDGGQYQISVTSPGNTTARTYKLNFKITASTNSKLKDLKMGDYIYFDEYNTTYYVNFPMGTTELPEITYIKGDEYQTVDIEYGGVEGTTRITVTAASGAQTIYKIICSVDKSSNSSLKNIFVGGVALEGFDPNITSYTYNLPIGTTELPEITYEQGDEYQTVTLITGGLNGTTRISVVAGDGSSTLYQITFSLAQSTNATLDMIYVDGQPLAGFDKDILDYNYPLPQGTTQLPTVTYDQHDEWQTITVRDGGVNGDYRITVKPQSGASRTYIIHFSVATSSETRLKNIFIDGQPLEDFSAETLNYTITLPVGQSIIPEVTFEQMDASQTVLSVLQGNVYTIRVIAEDNSQRVYTITFIIQKSENAFLKMIYLDGKPLQGFDPQELNYEYELTTATCPVITVDKEYGQQISILAPAAAGLARIIVSPEVGAANTYTINFTLPINNETLLDGILLNGQPIAGFESQVFEYYVNYNGQMPEITTTSNVSGQEVVILKEDDKVQVVVIADGNQTIYTIYFNRQYSTNAQLSNILLNGVGLQDFNANKTEYKVSWKGATRPIITYVKAEETQTVTLGQVKENSYSIIVIAEDGVSKTVYTINFELEASDDVELVSISLDGEDLGIVPGKFEYHKEWIEGNELPVLSYVKKDGQRVLSVKATSEKQVILVAASSGRTETYTIYYDIKRSSNAFLSDILLDGQSLQNFSSNSFDYVYQLEWRTKVVPVIQPISQEPGQTITISYSAVNGTTNIHVAAADGQNESDYNIAFPVLKSNNTALEYVEFDGIELDFDPEKTDYDIVLPLGMRAVPAIHYTASEPEQKLHYISKPVSETTQIIVTAENGDTRTYNFNFELTINDADNVLKSIFVVELDSTLNLVEGQLAGQTNLTIDLPYGTRSFTLAPIKNFDEQTVLVQPGGVNNPTIITVRSNRAHEDDVVYTITPKVSSIDPASLAAIYVNGEPIDGFNPQRTSYIVKVDGAPTVNAFANDGAFFYTNANDSKHWQGIVTDGTHQNTYDLYFYYANDTIPNPDFTEWNERAANNDVNKPDGWNVIADALGRNGSGSYVAGDEVQNDGNGIAHLYTRYLAGPGGIIPGFMTLGTVTSPTGIKTAGATRLEVSGGISFRNSPDSLLINYKQTQITDGGSNHIVYQLNGEKLEYGDRSTFSDFVTRSLDLSSVNNVVSIPQTMNIILNSECSEGGSIAYHFPLVTQGATAHMYVDWLRFVYNNTLVSIETEDEDILLPDENNHFTLTRTDAEDNSLPKLTFNGEVSDQAQEITWTTEVRQGQNMVRTATIRNFGEDGNYQDYTLDVIRPLSTDNTLSRLEVGGQAVEGWNAEQTEYTIEVEYGTVSLPDVLPYMSSQLQTIQLTEEKDKVIIKVTPELGDVRTYTITFVTNASADVTLKSLTVEGITYDPEVYEYDVIAAQMPAITFEKMMDGQIVDLNEGVLTITAENGKTTGQYIINFTQLVEPTSARLTDISLDDNTIEGFSSGIYSYTKDKPQTTSFIREYVQDEVVQTITDNGITWLVKGTDGENTYRLLYPNILTDSVVLRTINIEGQLSEEFVYFEQQENYVVYTDEDYDIFIEPATGQTINVSSTVVNVSEGTNAAARLELTYTINIEAETGDSKTYTIEVKPDLSDNALLRMIYLNGERYKEFVPSTLNYNIVLPSANPKKVEPQMPDITYVAGNRSQKIEIENGNLGEYTYITVSSEDGNNQSEYQLLIEAEPSHNADLSGIMINGVVLTNFTPERHYYSMSVADVNVDVKYSTEDNFQTITQSTVGTEHIIYVTAQDGYTKAEYLIELHPQSSSSDATLQHIWLDGQTMYDYTNGAVSFSPMNNSYNIPLATDANIPDISVSLQSDKQSVDITQTGYVVTVDVVAEDGTRNTYTLNFIVKLSSDANLVMLYVGSEELEGFDPNKNVYNVELPIGTETLPVVTARMGDKQHLENETYTENSYSVDVVAEDGTRKTYYINFTFLLSDADYLLMIYADGEQIDGFAKDKYFYTYDLAVGTTDFPELSYDKADRWQTVEETILVETASTLTVQYQVYAQNGKKSTYTVTFNILKSSNTNLQGILVDNKLLEGFSADVYDYDIVLPLGTTVLPNVDYIAGDEYQTVEIINGDVNSDTKIVVTAQDGTQVIYTLNFSVAKNNNALLDMLFINGVEIDNFDPEIANYTAPLVYGWTAIPAITYTKAYDEQNVTISIDGMKATINVVAEDGTQFTYTITFYEVRSDNAYLLTVYIDGERFYEFDRNTFEYHIPLPYTVEEMPQITWKADDDQQVIVLEKNSPFSATIIVTAGNGEDVNEYMFYFERELCPINSLENILIRGVELEGFNPDVLVYSLVYPARTSVTDLATIQDVDFVKAEKHEAVEVTRSDDYTLMLTVRAENGDARVYVILQEIQLPDNALLEDIIVGGQSIAGFDPDVFEYEYYLFEGELVPSVDAIAQDADAEVDITLGTIGELTYIYCTAPDGTENIYTIRFEYSSINTANEATAKDVVLKHIKGSNQYVAFSIRQNVKIMLMDVNGSPIAIKDVPVCNPNAANVVIDAEDMNLFYDAIDPAQGTIITIDNPRQLYFYAFLTNDKKVIKSGKIMLEW